MGDFLVDGIGPGHARAELGALLGVFALDRRVAAELGAPLCDDPETHRWFVVCGAGGVVAGFAAVVRAGTKVMFTHDYVCPEWRRRGLHTRLVRERLEWARAQHAVIARATVTPAGLGQYLVNGFSPIGTRGRYTIVEARF